MLLKQLTIAGFKSFAERTALSFDRGITAIVGPNGSGKSNLVDAIRWALGEQSKKSLRGKKGEDIIFAGAKNKSSLSLAQVSLTLEHIPAKLDFQKNGKAKPLTFSEATIKRTLSRDGCGEYFLNKSKVRLKDVATMMAESGFGPKNYIIGQGMIDRVIALGPEEKKDLLSEASGVKPLELKRQEAEKKLAATLNNLNQIRALASEIEPHLGRLKRQAALAGREEKIKKELGKLQKIWYQEKLACNRENLQKILNQKQEQSEKKQALEDKIKNLKTSIRQNEAEQIKIRGAWKNSREEETRLIREKNGYQEKIAILLGQIKAQETFGTNWRSQNQKEISRLASEIQNIAEEKRAAEAEEQKQSKLLDQTGKALNQTRGKISTLEKKRIAPLKFPNLIFELQVLLKEQEIFVDGLKNALDPEEIKKRAKYIYALLKNILTSIVQAKEPRPRQDYSREMEKLKQQEKEIEKTNDQIKAAARNQAEKINFLRYQKETLQNKIFFLQNKLQSKEKEPINLSQIREELRDGEKILSALGEKISALNQKIEKISKAEQEKKDALFNLDRALRQREQNLMILEQTANRLDFDKNVILSQKQTLLSEIKQELGENFGQFFDLKQKSEILNPGTENKIQKLKNKLAASSNIDPEIIKEYEQTNSRYQFLRKEANDLARASEALNQLIERLNHIIQTKFNASFQKINRSFSEYFRAIFRGGRANLALDREEGMTIQVSPPGKKLSDVTALSGGEKALTGLALIFGIISLTRPPFCVLDEVDAALDEANSRRFSRILKTLSAKTQFLAITHNRETMQAADVIYGVTMSEKGVSRLLSIKMSE